MPSMYLFGGIRFISNLGIFLGLDLGRTCVGNVKNNDPSLNRADGSAMNLNSWLAAVLVMLALAGCVQVATGQGRPPYDNNMEYPRDRGGDGGGGGGGGM
jgi:hypothetical protein